MTYFTPDEQAAAADHLRELFPAPDGTGQPGASVTTVVSHVSSSGMTRWISVLAVADGRIVDVSWLVRKVFNQPSHRTHNGVRMGGTGMDMGFALVYDLASKLYGDGYALSHNRI